MLHGLLENSGYVFSKLKVVENIEVIIAPGLIALFYCMLAFQLLVPMIIYSLLQSLFAVEITFLLTSGPSRWLVILSSNDLRNVLV